MALSKFLSTWARGATSMPTVTQLLQLMKARRSIYPKDFTGNNSTITRQHLEMMLEAARWAPTHRRTEPWHFVVLSGASKTAFEELTLTCCSELLPSEEAKPLLTRLQRKQAKEWSKVHSYIAICMKRHADKVPEWEEIAAVSCGVQNLSLVAASLGVSGYWSSWQAVARDSAVMSDFLGLDSSRGDRCLGVWVVGHAEEERVGVLYKAKRKGLEDKVDWRE